MADLTYVSTWSGWAYVAFVVDAYPRRILGWRVASTMNTTMVLDSIEQAIWARRQEGIFDLKDVVHHTDRGSQYTSIREELSKPVDRVFQATSVPACWSSPCDGGVGEVMSVGRSRSLPLWKVAPARTRATRCGALTDRQRAWAASISL